MNDDFYLVGGWALPLWKIWVRQLGWFSIPNWMESFKIPWFQTTNQANIEHPQSMVPKMAEAPIICPKLQLGGMISSTSIVRVKTDPPNWMLQHETWPILDPQPRLTPFTHHSLATTRTVKEPLLYHQEVTSLTVALQEAVVALLVDRRHRVLEPATMFLALRCPIFPIFQFIYIYISSRVEYSYIISIFLYV